MWQLEFPIEQLQSSLLRWYGLQGRQLPWRSNASQTVSPYAIWVSEIMLQQTQVKTVIPYFARWLAQFPTVAILAQAKQQAVLMQWQGLGYYARARNLHRAAQMVMTQHQGLVPQDFENLLALPGIGRSTAGGILSAAFNLPYPILDGNVKRVVARLVALSIPPAQALADLWYLSEQLLDRQHPREFNQALMDLGATVCLPRAPVCGDCPWQRACQAYALGLQAEIPQRVAAAPLPHQTLGVAVIRNEAGAVLIDRRPESGLLGGLWEFPGIPVTENESIADGIRQGIPAMLGIQVLVGDRLLSIDHAYTHLRVTLVVYDCHYLSGEPQPLNCDEVRWVTLTELGQLPFSKANIQIIHMLSGER